MAEPILFCGGVGVWVYHNTQKFDYQKVWYLGCLSAKSNNNNNLKQEIIIFFFLNGMEQKVR